MQRECSKSSDDAVVWGLVALLVLVCLCGGIWTYRSRSACAVQLAQKTTTNYQEARPHLPAECPREAPAPLGPLNCPAGQAPAWTYTVEAQPAQLTNTPTKSTGGGACTMNKDCSQNSWCNDSSFVAWCAQQNPPCPSPQCTGGPPPPTQAPTPAWATQAPMPCATCNRPSRYPSTGAVVCVDTSNNNAIMNDSKCATPIPAVPQVMCSPAPSTCPPTNPMPEQGKVIWSYLCSTKLQTGTTGPGIDNDLTKNNSLVNLITQQKVNYLCLGFLEVLDDGGLGWGTSCKTDYETLGRQLTTLHNQYGVCISASIGGQNSGAMYKNMTDASKALSWFEETRKTYKFLDGIDFDVEELNEKSAFPTLGNNINAYAKAFKDAGYVVTAAPAASQISPGCGGNADGNGYSAQNLINLNMDHFDGIMIQWYQGGTDDGNGGQSPLSAQGIVNFYIALSGNSNLQGYKTISSAENSSCGNNRDTQACINADNPPVIGACTATQGQYHYVAKNKWDTCTGTCYKFDPSKIAIGFQTYAPGCSANIQWDSGAKTYDVITTAIKLLQQNNVPFLGIASWAVYNVFCSNKGTPYSEIFPEAHKLMNA